MSIESIEKRIAKSQKVSAKAWYEYCQAKGYHFNSYDSNNILALEIMKQHITNTKAQKAFLLLANKVAPTINQACVFSDYRDYIMTLIGYNNIPRTKNIHLEMCPEYIFNLTENLGNLDIALNGMNVKITDVDFAIEHKNDLLKRGAIEQHCYDYLTLLEIRIEAWELESKDPLNPRVSELEDLLTKCEFDIWPMYHYRQHHGRNKIDLYKYMERDKNGYPKLRINEAKEMAIHEL